MDWENLKIHLIDIAKGMIAAAIVGAFTSLLSYLGAHIPDLLNLLAGPASAVAAIKKFKA